MLASCSFEFITMISLSPCDCFERFVVLLLKLYVKTVYLFLFFKMRMRIRSYDGYRIVGNFPDWATAPPTLPVGSAFCSMQSKMWEMEAMDRAQYVYKKICYATVGDELSCRREVENYCDLHQ